MLLKEVNENLPESEEDDPLAVRFSKLSLEDRIQELRARLYGGYGKFTAAEKMAMRGNDQLHRRIKKQISDLEFEKEAISRGMTAEEFRDQIKAGKTAKQALDDLNNAEFERLKKAGTPSTIALPTQLSNGGSGKFANPYFLDPKEHYAGTPALYPNWSKYSTSRKNFVKLSTMLTTFGVEDFTKMYSGLHSSSYFNFALIGGKGKFVWRKYDAGGGSGQNWCYINGTKHITTDIIAMYEDPTQHAKLKALLDPIV
jgi:hypothetical protein